jgi:hypothetical protein
VMFVGDVAVGYRLVRPRLDACARARQIEAPGYVTRIVGSPAVEAAPEPPPNPERFTLASHVVGNRHR